MEKLKRSYNRRRPSKPVMIDRRKYIKEAVYVIKEKYN